MRDDVLVSMIVAMAKNRVIGIENRLPWHIPEDLKYFKAVTMGKPIIMGRKTYESIGRPLPGRANIVVTRNSDYAPEGVMVVNNVIDALDCAKKQAKAVGESEIFIIGGEQLYRESLPFAEKIYLTEVEIALEGDAYFPIINPEEWCELNRQEKVSEGREQLAFSFVTKGRL